MEDRKACGIKRILEKPILPNQLHNIFKNIVTDTSEIEKLNDEKTRSASAIIKARNVEPLKILLAEDNYTNREVALHQFKKLGYDDITYAQNGLEAVEILGTSDHAFDLVFMDCQMPEMDGYEATQYIRNGECGKKISQIYIIAMTANALVGDRELCLKTGMNDYVTKPVVVKKLSEAIERFIVYRSQVKATSAVVESDTKDGLDHSQHKRITLDENDFPPELVQIFIDESEKIILDLENNTLQRNQEKTVLLAHSLKGMSANFQAEALNAVASSAEKAALAKDFAQLERLLPSIKEEYEYFKNAINSQSTNKLPS